MASISEKRAGAAIAILAAIIAAAGLMFGHLAVSTGVGVAVVGILIGTGVARGKFSRTEDTTKRN